MNLLNSRILMANNESDARDMWFLSIVSHFSLFPLLFKSNLILIKISLFLTHSLIVTNGLKSLWSSVNRRSFLFYCELLYLFGLIGLLLYEFVIQYSLKLDKRLPFLPLMLTSVYCSIGIMYFWLKFYGTFLLNGNSIEKIRKE